MVKSLNLFGEMIAPKKKKQTSAKKCTKSDSAYRTISEAANQVGVATHVLRFWETKFPQIQPMKRGGGRRYYRPEDIQIIERIQDLLHNQGYTIKGVQLLLEETKNQKIETPSSTNAGEASIPAELLEELEDIRQMLD